MHQGDFPSPARAWRTIALLCCLFTLSFVDRMVLALVVDPVRAALAVNDTQISLLFGLGFVLVYVIAGLPAAHFIDRGNRKRILIGGVAIWSTATFCSGLVSSFTALVVCRSGVAVGEAVLMPVAMSMIGDLFAPDKRTLPTTIYTMTGVLMASGAFILGATALKLAILLSPLLAIAPWRLLFIIVALPSPLLILLVHLLVDEPVRRPTSGGTGEPASTAEFFGHLTSRLGLYLPMFLGTGFVFSVSLATSAWGPTLLSREHHLDAASAGFYYGIFSLIGGAIAVLCVTTLVRRIGGGSPVLGVLRTAILVNLAAFPAFGIAIASGTTAMVLAGIGLSVFGSIATASFTPIVLQTVTPTRFIGRASALYLLFNNLMGMGFGPLLAARINAGLGPTASLGTALSLLGWGGLALSLACYFFALWRLNRVRGAADTGDSSSAKGSAQGRGVHI